MTAVVTINFQIMGRGSIEVGGAASVSIAGPYWNTITIVAPSSPYVTFTVLPSEWAFVMWGGQVIEISPGIARLEFPVDVSASYLAVAVFAESTGSPTLCTPQKCYNTYTSAPPEPTHESIRVARRCECAKKPPLSTSQIPNCRCRQHQRHRTVHHRTERDRMLAEVVRCPLYFQNRDTGGLCAAQHATVHSSTPPLLGAGTETAPHALHTRRPFHRIRGIEEICKPVRSVSGAELTARIRARTEASHATLTRHSEHFRVTPPPPARLCPPPRQPTRPTAPVTPCIIGNQRVDYTTGKS